MSRLLPKTHRNWAITYLIDDKPPAQKVAVEAASIPAAIQRFSGDFHWQVEWPKEIDIISVTLQPEKV